MSTPDNKTPVNTLCWEKHTEDGQLSMGMVNPDGIISAFKVRGAYSAMDPVPHYMQMDNGPKSRAIDTKNPRKGGTLFRGGGVFKIKHGDFCSTTAVDGGVPGIEIDATNGQLVLKSAKRIVLMAENIDLIAKGPDGKNGNVQINANEKVLIKGDTVALDGKQTTTIFSEDTVEIFGNTVTNIYGGMLEMLDGDTSIKGSTGFIPSVGTIQEIKTKIKAFLMG